MKEGGVASKISFSSIFDLTRASDIHFTRLSIGLNSSLFPILFIEISVEVTREILFFAFSLKGSQTCSVKYCFCLGFKTLDSININENEFSLLLNITSFHKFDSKEIFKLSLLLFLYYLLYLFSF